MPLINNSRQRERETGIDIGPAALKVQPSQLPSEKSRGFEDFSDEDLDSDMEGSVMYLSRPKKAAVAPVLPPRSEKRVSRMLGHVMLELQNLDGSREKNTDKPAADESNPHELYLSSEEDASLSDYEGSLVDFDAMDDGTEERSEKPGSRASRKSQEVTARVVSFTLVKPQIIDIHSHSTSTYPTTPPRPDSTCEPPISRSGSPSGPTLRRPSPLKLYPNSLRRLSISSIARIPESDSTQSIPPTTSRSQLLPRKSSRMANLTSLVTQSLRTSSSHAFLSHDPFPSYQNSPSLPENEPETPTSMPPAALKNSLTRSLLKSRKPSMPQLNQLFNSSHNGSMMDLSQASEPAQPKQQRRKSLAFPPRSSPIQPSQLRPTSPHKGPLRYEDIMKNVIREPPVPAKSPLKSRTNSMLGLGRRKSIYT